MTGSGRATLTTALANVWERRGRPAQGLHHARQALDLHRTAGHRRGQANALNAIGWYHALFGDHQQTLTCYQQAIDLFRDFDDRYNEATSLTHLGDTHLTAGNRQAARDAWQHALTILEQLEHPKAHSVRIKLHHPNQTPPDDE